MWVVQRTIQNHKEVNEFFTNLYKGTGKRYSGGSSRSNYKEFKTHQPKHFIHYPPFKDGKTSWIKPRAKYELVTLEQLKKNLNMKLYYTKVESFLRIINVACDNWKIRLDKYAKEHINLKNLEIEVEESFISEMLAESNLKQASIIKEIFPNYINQNYVPFTFEDRDLFRGKWLRRKTDKAEFYPCEVYQKSIYFQAGNYISYVDGFERFEFLDGTPFGKLK